MAKCKRKGVELVVPGKRVRNYRVVAQVGHGDQIVEVLALKNRSKWVQTCEEAHKLLLRRMALYRPHGKAWVLYRTLLDESFRRSQAQLL